MGIGWLFTHLLLAVGVLRGSTDPFIGLMVFYSFSILRPPSLWFWESWLTHRMSFYVGCATLVGWLMQGFGDWSGLRGVKLPLAGFFIYLFMGFFTWQFTSIHPPTAWRWLYPQITIGVMLMVTISLVRSEKQIKILAWVIVITLGYLAEVFNQEYFFTGWNRVYWRGFGGIDNNGVAMIMVAGVAPAFFMAILTKKLWIKGLCLLAALMLIHEVLLTFSRGGMLGLCIVGAGIFFVAMFYLPKKMLTLFVAVVCVIGTLHLAGAEIRSEFWSIFADPEERDASAASRFVTWRGAWRCMLDHPLGVGPRNFNLISHSYGVTRGKSVHNLFLQTGADYGFIGMIGLCMFYFGAIFNTFMMTRTQTAKRLVWPRYYGHMCSIALGGFLICSTFVGMESVEIGYIIASLGLCTTAYVNRIAEASSADQAESVPELQQVPIPDPLPYEDITAA